MSIIYLSTIFIHLLVISLFSYIFLTSVIHVIYVIFLPVVYLSHIYLLYISHQPTIYLSYQFCFSEDHGENIFDVIDQLSQ